MFFLFQPFSYLGHSHLHALGVVVDIPVMDESEAIVTETENCKQVFQMSEQGGWIYKVTVGVAMSVSERSVAI